MIFVILISVMANAERWDSGEESVVVAYVIAVINKYKVRLELLKMDEFNKSN